MLVAAGWCATLPLFAQKELYGLPTQSDAVALQQRVLVVELLSLLPEREKKLAKNPEKLAAEKAFIAHYNQLIRETLPTYWKVNQRIEFKLPEEANRIIINKYAVLRASDMERCFWLSNGKSKCEDTFSFVLYKAEDRKKVQFILSIPDAQRLSAGDVVFMCQQFNNAMADAANGATEKQYTHKYFVQHAAPTLAQRKVLFLEPTLKVEKEKIAGLYTHPFEIASDQASMEAVITTQDSAYAYLNAVWAPAFLGFGYVATDAKDGRTLLMMGSGALDFEWYAPSNNVGVASGISVNTPEYKLFSYKSTMRVSSAHLKRMNNVAEE